MIDPIAAIAEVHQLLERALAIADREADTHLAALLDEVLHVARRRMAAVIGDESNAF